MSSAFIFAVCLRDQSWLAQLRSAESKHPLSWGLPGGRVEPEERPRAAAVREFYEEVGVVVDPKAIHLILSRGGRSLYVWPVMEKFQADPNAAFAHESAAHVWMPLNYCPSPATKWLQKMHKEAVVAFNEALAVANR